MLDGLFEQFLQFYHMDIRVGFGFDVHQIAVDRPLWLGGIKVKNEQGLLGHSDADVLLHAICDALLGAAGLRDIGHYFPNTDENWKGADSKQLLAKVCSLIREQGWGISNIDATLVMEKPKISSHIDEMKLVMSQCMGIDLSRIGIKATTNEKLGYVGALQGADAYAVALIFRQ
jgi:2-C-methyl-D-erythritol 2,4-cyclodiphosphate synthase